MIVVGIDIAKHEHVVALLGLGSAPIFPSMIHETPRRFGIGASQAVIGLQMATAYVGYTVMPPLVGALAGTVGLIWLPLLVGMMLSVYACMGKRGCRGLLPSTGTSNNTEESSYLWKGSVLGLEIIQGPIPCYMKYLRLLFT